MISFSYRNQETSIKLENVSNDLVNMIVHHIFQIDYDFIHAVKEVYKEQGKVPAVRLYKEKYNCSLVIAKKAVEDICE